MFDTPELRALLQRHGPRIASFALAALIAAEIARASMSLFHAVRPLQPAASRPAPVLSHEPFDAHQLLVAHLFGAVVDPVTPRQEQKPTAANLLLAGTFATADPNQGMAIISSDGGPSKLYSVGQPVGGALLRSVYLDHVLLNRSGVLETLALRKLVPGATEPRRPVKALVAAAASE